MMYQDIIHGRIDFRRGDTEHFISDLLQCPEVQRLRHMRLLNFDVPFVQELATARRYAHAVGTCHLAFKLASTTFLNKKTQNTLIAAALLHDIGIPPYGHLVEAELHRRNPTFSHESLVHQIIYGTYHPTNIYHQILPSRSLRLAAVLRKHELKPEDIIGLVCPAQGNTSPISSGIDLDNIDNVHRMAALLGMPQAHENLAVISKAMRLTPEMELTFHQNAISAINTWLQFRSDVYRIMIGHPECVAYNAYLKDLVSLAIDKGIISHDLWYLSDSEFEYRLLNNKETSNLAIQLIQGCQYKLVDYVWLHSIDSATSPGKSILPRLELCFSDAPLDGLHYFFWVEKDRISRKLDLQISNTGSTIIGKGSFTALIALINHGEASHKLTTSFQRHNKEGWRDHVINLISNIAPDWKFHPYFPEDFSVPVKSARTAEVQFDLF